jgi:hypothetical protein
MNVFGVCPLVTEGLQGAQASTLRAREESQNVLCSVIGGGGVPDRKINFPSFVLHSQDRPIRDSRRVHVPEQLAREGRYSIIFV